MSIFYLSEFATAECVLASNIIDGLVKSLVDRHSRGACPRKGGEQESQNWLILLDSRFHGNDTKILRKGSYEFINIRSGIEGKI